MSARLGNVLFWASILIAGGWVWLNYHYEQQNSAITWGGAALAWLVGRACQYVLDGGKLDDDKKQKGKQSEAKSEKDTNTISNENVALKEEDVLKAQVAFEQKLELINLPDSIRGREIYVYRNLMSKWFNDLNPKYRYDDSMSMKIRTDWYDYMGSLEREGDAKYLRSEASYEAYRAEKEEDRKRLEAREWSENRKAQEARKRFITIEDGFAAAMGEEAVRELQEVRSRDDKAFERSGTMAPIGYYYDINRELVPIGYHHDFDGELVSDDPNAWELEWRQANAYDRLQKLRDFVERSGGLVYDAKRPNKVWFLLPYAILKELFEPNAKIFVYRDHDGAITEQNSGILPWGEPIQMFLGHDKIKIPESASSIASTGQAAMIDLYQRRRTGIDYSPSNLGLLNQLLRSSSGSLTIFAAIRRASSLLSSLAADRRPGR